MDKEIRRDRSDTPDTLHHVIGRGIERRKIADNFSDRKKFYKVKSYSLKN